MRGRLVITGQPRNSGERCCAVSAGQLTMSRTRLVCKRPGFIEAPEHREQPRSVKQRMGMGVFGQCCIERSQGLVCWSWAVDKRELKTEQVARLLVCEA